MTVATDPRGRVFAAAIALLAAAGLIVQFAAEVERSGSYGATLWLLLRYFTILTNLLVAIVFGRLAVDLRALRHSWLLAGTVFSIVLVGVVYELLLRGLLELSGGANLANLLLHVVTPILAPLYWLAVAPKGALRYRDPLIWAIFPFGYLFYALLRGAAEGRYAYPFIDVAAIGGARTAINCLAIGIGFLVLGWAFVWLDHFLARGNPRPRHI